MLDSSDCDEEAEPTKQKKKTVSKQKHVSAKIKETGNDSDDEMIKTIQKKNVKKGTKKSSDNVEEKSRKVKLKHQQMECRNERANETEQTGEMKGECEETKTNMNTDADNKVCI